jgi:hypothetical protein
MMKWLRKHTKRIMVVVVLLAMFSFVGGSALVTILSPNPGAEPFAMVFGQEISYRDHLVAQNDTAVLERLRFAWQFDPLGNMTVDHWLMLALEAERAGIQVSVEEVEQTLRGQVQRLEQAGFPVGYLDQLRSRGITIVSIRRAIRRNLAILKEFARVGDVTLPSESQVRHYVRDTEDKVQVRFVALEAEQFAEESEPLKEEEVQAQFEEYKDVLAADSETGYGYAYPRRVRVQYIRAAVQEIEPHLAVSFEEAKAHWKKHKASYRKFEYVDAPQTTTSLATTQPTTQPATQPTTQPTTKPTEKPKKIRQQVQKTFSEARQDVERDIRKKKADQLAEQAMRKATRELRKPWEDQKTDRQTGYKPVPPGVEKPDHMGVICERIASEFGIPLEYQETELATKEDLAAISVLRMASVDAEAGRRMGLPSYAFRVPPFVEEAVGRDAGLCLQLYQTPDGPLKANQFERVGERFMQTTSLLQFRVVEAREAEAPTSLAEVRADVERDLRLMRAFDRIESVAKEFCLAAAHLGTEAALEHFEELRTERGVKRAVSPPAFARRMSLSTSAGQERYLEALAANEPTLSAPKVRDVGTSEEFVDACFEMAAEGWEPPAMDWPPTPRTRAATTQPAATPAPKVRLLPIAKLNKWFVIELLGTEDVDQEKFDSQLRSTASWKIKREREIALRLNWFNPKSIEGRCGFEPIEAAAPAGADEGVEADEQSEPVSS